jgi:hypothetical protein
MGIWKLLCEGIWGQPKKQGLKLIIDSLDFLEIVALCKHHWSLGDGQPLSLDSCVAMLVIMHDKLPFTMMTPDPTHPQNLDL